MQKNYIMLTTTQLRQIIALAQNPTLNYIATYENEDGGATVSYWLDEDDEEAGLEPKESYTLKSAQPYADMQEAAATLNALAERNAGDILTITFADWSGYIIKDEEEA